MKCDVAVVGAGPAGAWAAYSLARRGARVAIFDPSHPREKACGGGVTRRTLELIEDAVPARSIASTGIRSARFGDAFVPLAPNHLTVCSRMTFDGALLDAARRAGATLYRSRVVDVATNLDAVSIRTSDATHHADFLIAADGANSLVRRRVCRSFRRDQLSVATGFFAHGVTSDEIVIELMSDPPGYMWSFPRPDHLAIGICAQADTRWTAGALRARAARWIGDSGIADGARLEPYAWPIPSLSADDFASMPIAGPRWLLAGDAAGLVDPITREGIYFAVASGVWAADAIACGPSIASTRYRARVRDEACAELARAARFKAIFFRPRFLELLARALRDSEAIRAVMADLIAGEQPYRSLKWRLLETMELRLAWAAFRTLN